MTTQEAYKSKCNQCAKCLGFGSVGYSDKRYARCWLDAMTKNVYHVVTECLNYRFSEMKLINLLLKTAKK